MNRTVAGVVLATFFGAGYFPVAPGTVGSLAALGLAYALHHYLAVPAWAMLVLAAALFAPACWASSAAETHFGGKDHSRIVVDEVVGQWITLAAADLGRWEHWLAAFVLFRFFDIAKPGPMRRLECIPGGLGVVLDDAAAGLCGMIVLLIFRQFSLF
jgi:phosphatidylglycerophosphatase A